MRILVSLCTTAIIASASTLLGFGAEVDYYNPTASGDFNYKTTSTHFSNDKKSAYQIGLYLEHPVALIPNMRIDTTPDTSFVGSGNTITLNQTDFTPYYEILDNIVDIDLGIAFRVLDVKIESHGIVNERFNDVIPMGYVAAGIDLPGVPSLTVKGDLKYVGYSGDFISDMRIKAVWKIIAGLQAQCGYRKESLAINHHYNTNADMTIKGPFIGLGYNF